MVFTGKYRNIYDATALLYLTGVVLVEGGLLHINLNYDSVGFLSIQEIVVVEGGLLHICLHL